MREWFFSLQFRLITAFTLVLAIALFSVSIYVGHQAKQNVQRLESEFQLAREERVQEFVSSLYLKSQKLSDIQQTLQKAHPLFKERVIIRDRNGVILADSQYGINRRISSNSNRLLNLLIIDEKIEIDRATARLQEASQQAPFSDPGFSRLLAAVNRSLLWAGIAAGSGGILLISLISQRILQPIRRLGTASRNLGSGDLTQRVSPSTIGELGELGRTFNSMATNLQMAEQQRQDLAADIAHELRTPLSNVRGYVEAIKDGLTEPDAPTIDIIHQQILHLNRLIEDLRLLALAEAGALELALGETDIELILSQSIDAILPRAQLSNIVVDLMQPTDLPRTSGDETRIRQIITNLLENALTHTPNEGKITVSSSVTQTNFIRIEITNTGPSISEEDLAQIFERFYRTDPSRSRSTGGTGLGLTIVKQLVELHGGTVVAENASDNTTIFIIELPISP